MTRADWLATRVAPAHLEDTLERILRLILEDRPVDLHRLAERLASAALERSGGAVRRSCYETALQLHEHQADQIRRLKQRIAELERSV